MEWSINTSQPLALQLVIILADFYIKQILKANRCFCAFLPIKYLEEMSYDSFPQQHIKSWARDKKLMGVTFSISWQNIIMMIWDGLEMLH